MYFELTIKCKKMSKMTIFILSFFFVFFRDLKLDYGKYRKIAKFPADAVFSIYFSQRYILESNISSSVLKI